MSALSLSKFRALRMSSTQTLRTLRQADEVIETSIVVPPDGGWGWVVVIAAFYCYFITDGGALTFGIFLETFVKEFNATKAEVSVSNSMFQGIYYLIGPVASGVANRYGFRACTIIGALICGSGYFLTTLNFVTLQTMYLFHGFMGGIGAGFVYIPATLIPGFYFDRWRAVATGIAVSAAGFGTLMFPIAISKLLESFDWKMTVRIIGGAQASCAIAALVFRPLKPQNVIAEPNKQTSYGLPSSVPLRPKTHIRCDHWLCCCNNCCGNCHSNKKFLTTKEALDTKRETALLFTQPRWSTNSKDPSNLSIYSQETRGTSMLSSPNEKEHFGCWTYFQVIVIDRICFCCKSKNAEVPAPRPLYRDDIFFHGSLMRIPKYTAPLQDGSKPATSNLIKKRKGLLAQIDKKKGKRQKTKKKIRASNASKEARTARLEERSAENSFFEVEEGPMYAAGMADEINIHKDEARTHYHMTVTRVATLKDVFYEQQRCRLCPQAVTRVISTMIDFSLLKSPSFLILATNSFITYLGIYVPYAFLTSRCLDHNLTAEDGAWQLSLIGIANTIGRIAMGILSSIPKISAAILFAVSFMISGLILIINEFYDSKNMMNATAIIYGFFIASIGTLKPILVFEIAGLENLTNAFGLVVLFQGLGVLCGVPLGGAIRDATGSYFYSMIFAASVLIIGGIVLLPLNKLNQWEKQKKSTIS